MKMTQWISVLQRFSTILGYTNSKMRMCFPLLLAVSVGMHGCKDKSHDEMEECFSDDDCSEGQTCVISHDHEGDDHDHGGACEI